MAEERSCDTCGVSEASERNSKDYADGKMNALTYRVALRGLADICKDCWHSHFKTEPRDNWQPREG